MTDVPDAQSSHREGTSPTGAPLPGDLGEMRAELRDRLGSIEHRIQAVERHLADVTRRHWSGDADPRLLTALQLLFYLGVAWFWAIIAYFLFRQPG